MENIPKNDIIDAPVDVIEDVDKKDDNGISQEDIDKFTNNPKLIDALAQDLVAARKDMKEGATWDKEKRSYIGEDGLPRDWAHLVGHLKNNPGAIKTAIESLQKLQSEDAPAEDQPVDDNIEDGADASGEAGEQKRAEALNFIRSRAAIPFYSELGIVAAELDDKTNEELEELKIKIENKISDKETKSDKIGKKFAGVFAAPDEYKPIQTANDDGAEPKMDAAPKADAETDDENKERQRKETLGFIRSRAAIPFYGELNIIAGELDKKTDEELAELKSSIETKISEREQKSKAPIEAITEAEPDKNDEEAKDADGTTSSAELAREKMSKWRTLRGHSTGPFGIPSKIIKNLADDCRDIMDASSQPVKDYFEAKRMTVDRDALAEQTDVMRGQLDEMSGFSFPWSKKGKAKRSLKERIARNEAQLEKFDKYIGTKTDRASLSSEDDRTVYLVEAMIAYVLSQEYKDLDGSNSELANLDMLEKELDVPIERRDTSLAGELGITASKPDEIRAEINERRKMLEARKREIITNAYSVFPEYFNKDRLAA